MECKENSQKVQIGVGKKIINYHCRLNNEEYARLKMLAESSGFSNTSSYVRSRLLGGGLSQEMKLNEILKQVKQIKEKSGENYET